MKVKFLTYQSHQEYGETKRSGDYAQFGTRWIVQLIVQLIQSLGLFQGGFLDDPLLHVA